MKKIIFILLVLSLLVVSGCGIIGNAVKDIEEKQLGDSKENIEQAKKDLEEVEERIAYVQEFSRQVQEHKELLKQVDDCVENKLIQQGYEDGVDCISGIYDNPLCENTERYTTEVSVRNECYDIYDPDELIFTRLINY